MKRDANRSLERTFIAAISQFAFCCHDAIEKVQNTASLPLFCYEHLASANLCTLHANRICNIFEHILTQENSSLTQRLQSFNPENILSGIAKTLTDTVANSISLKIDCDSDSICDFPVTVNQAKFEFAFLNLLYCSIRSGETSSHKTTRINLSVKELKDHLQFHIKDNGNLINPLIIENLRAGNPPLSGFISTRDTLISFSLDVADKIIFDMDGSFSYKALKSGNRYDIILPKFPKDLPIAANSPAIYIPAIRVYKEIFEDIIGSSSHIPGEFEEETL
ncbi:MAG: ATP-binding protein [Clostridia bacterium]|nr:ATP-binding protein [Clostridia bacterium]